MAGINILQDLAANRSSMASQLQPMLPGQQAAPPQQAQQPQQTAPQQQAPPEQMPGGAPQSVAQLRQLHQSQNAQLEARGQDLRIAQMLMRALNPAMPKGFRQLGLKNISQMLDVDPRGNTSKEIINTISGLDPESMEGLRRGLAEATTDAPPGQVTNMLRGTLTGQVPVDQLLDLATAAATVQPSTPGGLTEEAPPMMRLGAAPPPADLGQESLVSPTQAPGQVDAPGAPLGPRDPGPPALPFSAAPSSGIPRYREQEVSPRMREVAPELAEVLGLDLDQPYRNIDVIKGGFRRIPTDYEGQQKMAADIRGNQAGVIDTLQMTSHLAGLVQGRPEALDLLSVKIPGVEGEIGINVAGGAVQIKDFLRGLGRTMGVDISSDTVDKILREDLTNTETGKRITDNVVDWMYQAGANVQDTAEIRARIKSFMIPLAFAMAAAKGQTGRFLSDRDVALQLEELGRSQSPESFIGAMRDMTNRIYDGYNTRMTAQLGQTIPLTQIITPEARQAIINSPAAPAALIRALQSSEPVQNGNVPPGGVTTRRVPTETITPTPPVGDPNAGRFAAPPGALPRTGGAPPPPTEAAAPTRPPQTTEARRRMPRTSPTIEEEGQARVRLQEEDRAFVHEVRGQNRRRMEIAESAERRAQRAEVEQRRERIRAAFAQMGAALRGSISGGGGGVISGGGGGDQDPAAFRVAPPPRRAPPTPVNAAPYQPQPRRRGG